MRDNGTMALPRKCVWFPARQHLYLIYAANINQLVCGQQTALMVVWLALSWEGKPPQWRASTPTKPKGSWPNVALHLSVSSLWRKGNKQIQ